MATLRSTSTAVFRGSFEEDRASTEPLEDWSPIEEFREQQLQLLHEVLEGGWKTGVQDEMKEMRQPLIYLKCYARLTSDILNTKIWSLVAKEGSCKHSRILNSPRLSVLNDIWT